MPERGGPRTVRVRIATAYTWIVSWHERCAALVAAEGLDPACLRVLHAFGGPAEGPTPSLAELEVDPEILGARIVSALDGEVDRDQAELFGRRFEACAGLLGALPRGEGRVLRIGLLTRCREILGAAGPHALRIRACVDFYTSHGALLHHARPGLPRLEELVPTWRTVAPGVEHAVLEGPTERGPVHVNLLRVGDAALRVVDLRGTADFAAEVRARGAVAGVSGGFFLYSEPDIEAPFQRGEPVGLLATDRLVAPPVFRRASLDAGRKRLEVCSLVGWEVLGHRVVAVNALAEGPVVFNRAWGPRAPEGRFNLAIAHEQVTRADAIPLNGFVLSLPGPAEIGPLVWPEVRDQLSGGPWLLREGEVVLDLEAEDFAHDAPPITFSRDETFDQNLLPRLAVGRRGDGRLVFAAVDGRNFERAPGMTLRSTAELLAGLGCADALNLDGGSSKRMVVDGRVVDLATTELIASGRSARMRPVRNGILVLRARP